jgi:hypothetical protein
MNDLLVRDQNSRKVTHKNKKSSADDRQRRQRQTPPCLPPPGGPAVRESANFRWHSSGEGFDPDLEGQKGKLLAPKMAARTHWRRVRDPQGQSGGRVTDKSSFVGVGGLLVRLAAIST